jgi:hypothetical protein
MNSFHWKLEAVLSKNVAAPENRVKTFPYFWLPQQWHAF